MIGKLGGGRGCGRVELNCFITSSAPISEIKSSTKTHVLGLAGKRNKMSDFYLLEQSFE
jgi:hypothetical protein